MAWTSEQIDELKRLWDEGLSTAEIGRRLNVSKNAVVGKTHRLGLKPRPSPIAGKTQPKPQAKRRTAEKAVDIIDLAASMCRWPIGDPGDAGFHFCARKVVPGKPYCEEHCAIAYVSKSSSRDRSSGSNR